MFWKKRNAELDRKIYDLEVEIWKINNPPFKKGQKVYFQKNILDFKGTQGIVSTIELIHKYNSPWNCINWQYKVIVGSDIFTVYNPEKVSRKR